MASSTLDVEVLRLAAFTDRGRGGNPAGVVLEADGLDAVAMQEIAAAVGYSETAFVRSRKAPAGPRSAPAGGRREYDVRYFTPEAEVPFCGHATIATAVALARRDGLAPRLFHVPAGEVPVDSRIDADGRHVATLTSVAPRVADVSAPAVSDALVALGWRPEELDPRLPPRMAYAGSDHLVLAAATRERLARLEYDYDGLRAVMLRLEAVTVALIWREDTLVLHARNPAPAVGVVEDPATGSAAAAVGAYLVALGAVTPPATLVVRQGDDMGCPSRLTVGIASGGAGIRVSGTAVTLPAPAGRWRDRR